MDLDLFRPLSAELNRTGLDRDTALLYVLLASQSKAAGGSLEPFNYETFQRIFAWGPMDSGDRYLTDMLLNLQDRGWITFNQDKRRGFAVSINPTTEKNQYFANLARSELVEWSNAITAESLSEYLLLASLWLANNGPFQIPDTAWLDDHYGKWRGKSRSGYVKRHLKSLQDSGLINFRSHVHGFTILSVSPLPDATGKVFRPPDYHPRDCAELGKDVRTKIWEADGRACCYCGISLENVRWETDHIIPEYMGGACADERNLATACVPHNSRRRWFAGIDRPETSDAWRRLLPKTWRGGPVLDVQEASTVEAGKQKRVAIVMV